MPAQPQRTVDIDESNYGLGSSDTKNSVAAYPASPIHSGEITRESLEEQFDELVLQGVVKNGLGIPSYDRDYTGADSGVETPDLSTVETGPGGLPASPYVPNPASPGPGSQNPADLPAPPEGFGQTPNSDTYGSGVGSTADPISTTQVIAGATLGAYGLGTSTPQK
jgi:hypothetical protein